MTHSPGPWRWETLSRRPWGTKLYDGNGQYIADNAYGTPADLRLIAAAPELLEALRIAATCVVMEDDVGRFRALICSHRGAMKGWWGLGLLVAVGCSSVVPFVRTPRPCQGDAMDLVWRGVYGRKDRAPDVWWVPVQMQTCGRVFNGGRGFVAPNGVCSAGYSWHDGMDLVWLGDWEHTALAHEAAHVAQARDGLPPDFNHVTAPFQPGGAMDVANARLEALHRCP